MSRNASHDLVHSTFRADDDSVLELCHFNLAAFPNLNQVGAQLRTLVIVAQDIEYIGDLSYCPLLENLWICETRVHDVAPIAVCRQLKTLHLYSNRISSIRHLAGLSHLKSLWINDNVISDISSLGGCLELETLNAANNQISDIQPGILVHSNLKTLNLAGNNIYLIEVLDILGQLPELTELVFEHAFYGSNPLCMLQHFELVALCHCAKLSVLNEKTITEAMAARAMTIHKMKRRYYETAWQDDVTQYIQQAKFLKEAIARMAPSLSYLLGYIDWSESVRRSPSERALALHGELSTRAKATYAQLEHCYRAVMLANAKHQLMFSYLGGITFETASAEFSRALLPERLRSYEVTLIRFPFEDPFDAPVHVTQLHDEIYLASRQGLPMCFIHEPIASPSAIDLGSIPHFLSKEYTDFKASRQLQLQPLLDACLKDSLTELDLSHMGISSLPALPLPSVTTARLAFNAFVDTSHLFDVLPNVVRLDARHNQISILSGKLPATARVLDLSGNMIAGESSAVLAAWSAKLEELIYDEYLIDHSVVVPPSYMLFSTATALQLEHTGLNDLIMLSNLKHIKHLSLRNSGLTTIDALARMTHLEHLFLGGNLITTIDPLGLLPSLQVLDCSCNRIASIDLQQPHRPFHRLVHLNLTDNRLVALDFVRRLPKLQELYIAFNLISDSGHLNSLAQAANLIILDLRGNAIVGYLSNYRQSVVYCSPALQILDGTPVTEDEIAQAKQLLVGSLTRAKLLERMDVAKVRTLTCLDLRSCQLVRIECFSPNDFQSLSFLNLDNNNLTDVSNLVHLRSLRCLSLSGNRLESLPDPAKVFGSAPGSAGSGTSSSGSSASGSGDGGRGASGGMCAGTGPEIWPLLAELYLDHNQFQRIADMHLESLSSELRILSARSNRLTRLDGIERVRGVQKLYLDLNQIRGLDYDMAAPLRSLKELSINDNRVKSVSFLRALPKIKYLHADRNRVADLTDVSSASLQSISLVANPVSRVPSYRSVLIQLMASLIRIDGASITEDEREAAKQNAPESVQWQPPIPAQGGGMGKQTLRYSNVTLDGSELQGTQAKLSLALKNVTLGGGIGGK
ncbi:hypothetical protein H9P43_001169 [Blastocladiella emersonii ATCC 22665]|nr:hypothetical protein H9P43_001169 [Blastocladiella emersonii ATCC 22665]